MSGSVTSCSIYYGGQWIENQTKKGKPKNEAAIRQILEVVDYVSALEGFGSISPLESPQKNVDRMADDGILDCLQLDVIIEGKRITDAKIREAVQKFNEQVPHREIKPKSIVSAKDITSYITKYFPLPAEVMLKDDK